MKCNEDGLRIIRESEGLALEAYLCPAGKLTIGYGHTGPDVKRGDVITEEVAERLLLQDVAHAEAAVKRLVKVPLNANQFSALVSWVYNLGEGKVRDTNSLRTLNGGDKQKFATECLPKWVKAGDRTLPGLVARRRKEQLLFLKAVRP